MQHAGLGTIMGAVLDHLCLSCTYGLLPICPKVLRCVNILTGKQRHLQMPYSGAGFSLCTKAHLLAGLLQGADATALLAQLVFQRMHCQQRLLPLPERLCHRLHKQSCGPFLITNAYVRSRCGGGVNPP